MNKIMTGLEIIEIIREHIKPHEFADDNYDPTELGLGNTKNISKQKGDIGITSYAHKITYFKEHDVYIKLLGWYSSYSGSCEWEDDNDNYSVVKPKEKTITVWE